MCEKSESLPALGGKFEVREFVEEGRLIAFNEPLIVEWDLVVEESDANRVLVEASFPNGMRYPLVFSRTSPMPMGRFDELSVAGLEQAIRRALCFDFMHSFFHPNEDPNYTLENWAIFGNFKDLVCATEDDG